MKNQRALRSLILTISLAGVLLLTMSYVQNLSKGVATSNPGLSENPFGLAPGQFTLEKTKEGNGRFLNALFVYRTHQGVVNIWSIPMKDGKVGMPNKTWSQPIYACMDFGPTVIQGSVDETLPITCHDPEARQLALYASWQWDITGRNLTGKAEALPQVNGIPKE